MSEQESPQSTWQRFWQVLQEAPPVPTQAGVAPPSPALDDEFDFLAEPTTVALPRPNLQPMALDPARLALLAPFASALPALADALLRAREVVMDDVTLDRFDGAGALWLCRVLVQSPTTSLPEHGPLVRLLQRAARSPDAELVTAAAEAIAHLDARAAQLDLVARLHADPQSLGHAGIDRVLATLKQIADGRCVREMEALLVARGNELSDVHAWQARHIVQVIRRSGRK